MPHPSRVPHPSRTAPSRPEWKRRHEERPALRAEAEESRDKRRVTGELRGGKEDKTGETNWKIDFLFPIFNPDNIYFVSQ